MYSKMVLFMCAAGIVSAGNLHNSPVGYSAAPALSRVSYSTHGSLTDPVTSYAVRPTLASYGAPSLSYRSYSTHSVPAIASYATAPVVVKQTSPITTYSSSPAVLYQTTSSHSTPLTYTASPVVNKIYATPTYSTFTAPAISTYHTTPIAAKTISPALSYSSHFGPLSTYSAAAPAYSTYSTVPALKNVVRYSAAPAVSHVSYSGLGANYSW